MYYIYIYVHVRGTLWRSWLRYWVTSRKVLGSIPGRNLSLGSTQPLTKISYMVKGDRYVGLKTLPPSLSRPIWGLNIYIYMYIYMNIYIVM